jgi:hypothetical protein
MVAGGAPSPVWSTDRPALPTPQREGVMGKLVYHKPSLTCGYVRESATPPPAGKRCTTGGVWFTTWIAT